MPTTPNRILESLNKTKLRPNIPLAIVACLLVFSASILIDGSDTVFKLILILMITVTSLLLIYDRGRLLQSLKNQHQKDILLDAITEVYWEWELRTGAINYNKCLLEILDYPEETENEPAFWKENVHPVDRPQQKYQLLRHIKDESTPYYSEIRIKDAEGIYHWFAARGKIVQRDKSGKAELMCGSLDCIQERKDLEQSLIHAHKMDALGQLTGGIAHDFNNILASILGYTELALDSKHSPEMARYLEQIQAGGDRAKEVLKQLLDYSRHSKAETKTVCLQKEILETTKMLHSTFPSSVDIIESMPKNQYFSRLDPNQLQRVLLNLCLNARDAMSNKGTLILKLESNVIESKRCSSCHGNFAGEFHVLNITDNGEGVNPRIIDKLFEPFFTTKEFGEGTGMGLAVVHGVVHDYRGHIIVNSELGKGTNIQLYFPAVKSDSLDTVSKHSNKTAKEQLDKNILIIEDDKFVAQFLNDLLATYGCDVEVAENSIEAIQAISRNKVDYDLVLSDQTMPGITGTEFASKLYTLKPELPVVLYSGTHLDLALCPGNVVEVLQKPINNSRLVQVIAGASASFNNSSASFNNSSAS